MITKIPFKYHRFSKSDDGHIMDEESFDTAIIEYRLKNGHLPFLYMHIPIIGDINIGEPLNIGKERDSASILIKKEMLYILFGANKKIVAKGNIILSNGILPNRHDKHDDYYMALSINKFMLE